MENLPRCNFIKYWNIVDSLYKWNVESTLDWIMRELVFSFGFQWFPLELMFYGDMFYLMGLDF